jgi:limonene-1,2-epoxide hydrolase
MTGTSADSLVLSAAGSAGSPGSPVEVVQAFIAAFERLDIDAALEYAAPEIVYQNVPFPPARGFRAFERQMRLMSRFGTGFEARMHNIADNGPIVLTERTDVLTAGRLSVSVWVCGTFEVRDGKIVLWRDRFDFADVLVGTARGLVRALISVVRER